MGVYNTILVPCPECDNKVEFQTKTGDCSLSIYNISCAPHEDIKGILGRSNYCKECDTAVNIMKDIRDFSYLIN